VVRVLCCSLCMSSTPGMEDILKFVGRYYEIGSIVKKKIVYLCTKEVVCEELLMLI
jgi:hypothetical protein